MPPFTSILMRSVLTNKWCNPRSSDSPKTALSSLLLRIAITFFVTISGKSISMYLAKLDFRGPDWVQKLRALVVKG